ncbi:MAG: IS66 family transposase, partial [Planctomycetes bacterium]|nr:IS66 family transposase [Planctomycetota bacterium]
MERIGRLYAIERVAKLNDLKEDGVRELRESSARPVLNELQEWLELARTQVLDKSPLAKAIHYA